MVCKDLISDLKQAELRMRPVQMLPVYLMARYASTSSDTMNHLGMNQFISLPETLQVNMLLLFAANVAPSAAVLNVTNNIWLHRMPDGIASLCRLSSMACAWWPFYLMLHHCNNAGQLCSICMMQCFQDTVE